MLDGVKEAMFGESKFMLFGVYYMVIIIIIIKFKASEQTGI